MTFKVNNNKMKNAWIVKNPISLSESQSKILNAFFVSSIVGVMAAMLGIILFYVYSYAALYNQTATSFWLLGIFSDYVEIVQIALSESPYVAGGSSYPPLAIAILYPFALMCRGVFAQYGGMQLDIDVLTSRVLLHPEFWISFVLFFLICTSLVVFLVIKVFKLCKRDSLKIACVIVFSAPFVFAIMRGNTIYFALIFVLLFLWLYENPKPILREIGYICLVLAGLIKIYPLFFGVFLLRKKKFFASCRVAVYFFVLFFLSFFMFKQGLGNFSTFVQQLGDFATNNQRLLGETNMSITSCLCKLLSLISPAFASSALAPHINMSIVTLIFVISAVAAIVTKSDFSRYIICASIVVLVPTVSYLYVLIFEILPFAQFVREYDTLSLSRRRFFKATFFFLFTTVFLLPANFIVHSLVVIAMLVFELVGVIKREIIPYFARKSAVTE